MKDVIEILKAAGEDTRLRIIALLAQGELAAQEISNVLGQSQPRVSRHIKLLAEAGIIEKRAEGSWVFAKLSSDPKLLSIINPIIDAIASVSYTHLDVYKRQTQFPDVQDSVVAVYPSGKNNVIVEFISKGTNPDKTKFELPICTIFTIENDKITKDYTYFDNSK